MATHIKQIIGKFLKKGKKRTQYQQKIKKSIEEFLGEETKKHIQLVRIYKNYLVFRSDASSFTYDFNLKKETLLAEIKKSFPEIEGIKIKTG
tara:strand:+ start:156 stop:431 length:276 start_codon:yes stop_codon:yes gene_type:complete